MTTHKHFEFGSWLKRAMEAALMTQTQFAERAGVSRAAVCKWIAGEQLPRGVNVVRIARALELSRDEVEAHFGGPAVAA